LYVLAIDAMTQPYRQFLGWSGVVGSTLAACFWAFWGIIENFHEGWYSSSFLMNLGLMMVQYLLAMTLFTVAALVAIRWPRIGGGLHVTAALWAAWFFHGAQPIVLYPFIVAPLTATGIAYWLGRPRPRRWAVAVVCGFPLITLLVCGAEPAYRVAGRLDDGNLSARRVAGNGVELIWAPEGPGWPRDGVTWEEAARRCRYLTEDGLALANVPQHFWRLPTVEEAVRSMQRHGRNCGGAWDAVHRRSSYKRTPDKESPLWDVHSKVIYWWTATEISDREALIIVYDGKIWPRPKRAHCGFRAVKDGQSNERSGR
jgi:hypothetical protein